MTDPSTKFRSSGDLVVDRRLRYAEVAAAQGDFTAAAELLEQTLPLAPDWAPLWVAFADVLEKLGRPGPAATAYERAATLDPSGVLGVAMHLARLGRLRVPAAPDAYVRALFDDYAARFERHLIGALSYCGPTLLLSTLARLGATQFARVIDLGCGTGLCGMEFRAKTEQLAGVDLSTGMIELARSKKIYDELAVGSNVDFLRAQAEASASLVLAADVLIYTGDLAPVFTEVRRVLAAGGHFAFTLQSSESGTFRVGSDLRYAHAEPYVRAAVEAAGLRVLCLEAAPIRTEHSIPVPGLVGIVTCDRARSEVANGAIDDSLGVDGPTLPPAVFESVVSTAITRNIEIEMDRFGPRSS